MKIVTKILFMTFAITFSLLSGCNTVTDPAELYKGESGDQIFRKGEYELSDHNYKEAIKRFEALDAQYPFGTNTTLAQLHIIYAYYMTSDYASAEAAADRFIHMYPTNPHVDYAYYMRGLSNYYQNMSLFDRIFAVDLATRDLTQIKKSYDDFAAIDTNYPNSAYAASAHQYLIYLRNIMADHELEVGQFYYDHQAYVAAANRANIVVRHYEGAPAVPLALVMMVKSYRALHLTQSEQDSLAVLKYNYPNSVYMKDAFAK